MATSKQTSLAVALTIVALAGVAAAVAQARASGRVDQVVTARTISLRGCLLGGPLGPSETRLQRLRRVEIGQPPAGDPDEPGADWPLRCETDAAGLSRALRDGPPGYLRGARGRLLTLTEGLFSPDAGMERTIPELSARLDAWELAVVAAGLPSADPDAEPEPGAASFRQPELSAPLPMTSAALGSSSQYGHAGLLLRTREPLREIALVDTKAGSARMLAVKGDPLPPFTASGDATTVFLPRATKSGLSLVDNQGALLWPGPGVVFAHATVSGGSYVACDEKDGCRLATLVRRGDAYVERANAALPRDQTHTLVNGILVSRAKNEDPETIFVSLPEEPGVPRTALVPPLAPWLRLRACRTAERSVLAVQGVSRTTFFFHDGDTWSEGQTALAPDFDTIGGAQTHLGCDEDGASIASREGETLSLLRCTRRGCERTVSRPLPGIRDLAFAAVGEKIFTARVVDGAGGYHATRAVWFRFATPEGLHVNEGLLLGDDEHGGHGVGFLDAVPVANGAVLVMSALGSRTRGTFLVSVDREGRFGRIPFD